jgi:hypothetical protein
MGRAAHREERATRACRGDPIGFSTSTALFGVTTPIITAFDAAGVGTPSGRRHVRGLTIDAGVLFMFESNGLV